MTEPRTRQVPANAARMPTPPTPDSEHPDGWAVGYARVSTRDQVLDRQVDGLRAAGCDRVETEAISGGVPALDRPGLARALDIMRAGDTLVVVSLDRLGRNVRDVLGLIDHLAERGIGLRIIDQQIDTATPTGRLLITMMGAVAEMEKALIAERTRDGLAAARRRGRCGGRPRALTREQVEHARQMHGAGQPVASIARVLGVSRPTVDRALAA